MFYDLEDGTYRTYPDGDEATRRVIRREIENKDTTISKLEKENQELKEQLEVGKEQYNDLVEEKENLQEQLSNSHQIEAQQKWFIEYLESESKELIRDAGYHQRICLEILEKYKEIIGCKE